MRLIKFFILLCLTISPLFSQTRYFNEIFPGFPPEARNAAFSDEGYSRSFLKVSFSALAGSAENSIDPKIIETLFSKQPSFIVESIGIIPRSAGEFTLLDAYNALGKTRSLAGRLYRSHTRNENIPLFEEVTRIESGRRNTAIADPPPASSVPPSETVHLRLKDANFGNSFYRGDINLSRYGLRFSLTNSRNLTYVIPVIREGNFTAQLYFEPISEGFLIYGLAGVADVSDFIASRIHMPSAVGKRLAVILSWVTEEIMKNNGKSPNTRTNF